MRWRLGWTLILLGRAASYGTTPGAAPIIAASTTVVSESTTAVPATTVPLTTTTSMSPSSVPTTTIAAKGAQGASRRFGGATAQVIVDTCDGSASGTDFAVDDRHVVTNQHVVGETQKVALHRRDGSIVMGIARAVGVVVSIENYGSLIPSSLAQAIVTGMIARPDHTRARFRARRKRRPELHHQRRVARQPSPAANRPVCGLRSSVHPTSTATPTRSKQT